MRFLGGLKKRFLEVIDRQPMYTVIKETDWMEGLMCIVIKETDWIERLLCTVIKETDWIGRLM